MTTPTSSASAGSVANPDYAVQTDDNITLLASKIIRDVLVTRGEPIRRAQLWQAVELAMGERSPDVDGVLKRDWFTNQDTGPGPMEADRCRRRGRLAFRGRLGSGESRCGCRIHARMPTGRGALHWRPGRLHQDL